MTSLKWNAQYNEGRESQKRFDFILRDIENKNELSGNPTLLDLGANDGFFSYRFADAGFNVTAVEPDNHNVFDHHRVTGYREWIRSADDLPEGPFDFALVLSVLHHIPAWSDVLGAVIARTRKAVYIEVPDPSEQHPKWHGSRDQFDLIQDFELSGTAVPVVDTWEVSRRFKRTVWRIDV
jgi:hypothetical protein